MTDEYLTIREAARRAGYVNTSSLYAAIRRGRLRTITAGPLGTCVTTPAWLDEYLTSLRFNTQFRGKPKGRADGDAGSDSN